MASDLREHVVHLQGVVFDSQAQEGSLPKFELLGSLSFRADGIVMGEWDIREYPSESSQADDQFETNIIRGSWSPETKEVFLDEYDSDGNVSTAHINGHLNWSENTMEATDEDGDLWEFKIVDSIYSSP
eukprot:TRINITY_DN20357_c0_g1_i1.p1 TRINITY_DN20357_c0_g1~~TRINITY_DN20357_c0_g1_i1.p1  ORF type:complete len:129 (-),score=15.87 TRINITY_DN20357_c0_g1_i1:232-618(-)